VENSFLKLGVFLKYYCSKLGGLSLFYPSKNSSFGTSFGNPKAFGGKLWFSEFTGGHF